MCMIGVLRNIRLPEKLFVRLSTTLLRIDYGKLSITYEKGNMRDVATLNQLLVLANLESYNAVLIKQGKNQKERMELLRQLAVQQLQTLEAASMNNLPKLTGNYKLKK